MERKIFVRKANFNQIWSYFAASWGQNLYFKNILKKQKKPNMFSTALKDEKIKPVIKYTGEKTIKIRLRN